MGSARGRRRRFATSSKGKKLSQDLKPGYGEIGFPLQLLLARKSRDSWTLAIPPKTIPTLSQALETRAGDADMKNGQFNILRRTCRENCCLSWGGPKALTRLSTKKTTNVEESLCFGDEVVHLPVLRSSPEKTSEAACLAQLRLLGFRHIGGP
nr:hypothetical protein Iba_chr11fCG4880 [Ipomoea batatas]